MSEFHFHGWATRHNVKCSDGRTIMPDAFKHNDGKKVPLVWNHLNENPTNVLGHAILEYRPEGIIAHGCFNDTEYGQYAKSLVEHKDIDMLSIYANRLTQRKYANGADVMHGEIREVSLVYASANPAAYIEDVMRHSDDGNSYVSDDECVIYTGLNLFHSDELDDIQSTDDVSAEDNEAVEHSDKEKTEKTAEQIYEAMSDKKKDVLHYIVGKLTEDDNGDSDDSEEEIEDANLNHSDSSGESISDIYNTFTDEEKDLITFVVGNILSSTTNKNEAKHSEGGDDTMKHNAFEPNEQQMEGVLSHSETAAIFADMKRYGSLKDSFFAHAGDTEHAAVTQTYGINGTDFLFPDAKTLNNVPLFIQRDMGWVQQVMKAVHHTPFSRIKSIFANITEEDARARGYIKGKLKKEEVFGLLKRTTTPTTIYKKQKLDRDDVNDIVGFDVIAWLKAEMRMMLDEEIARAILVGDGRLNSSDDKINEQNIRPIWTDEDLYTIKTLVDVSNATNASDKAKAFIRAAIKARKNYKGSGSPVLYTTEDVLTDCLLIEDSTGRIIYDDVAKLSKALRVSNIVTVPVMEGLKRTDNVNGEVELWGIIVNLSDYNIGADKGGAVNMFDNFDIDYNAQKYLIETRCSGALIKPYSAIAIEMKTSEAVAG